MLKIIKLWLPVVLCMGFIFYNSSLPGTEIKYVFAFQDVVYHIGIFLLLGFFFSRALNQTYIKLNMGKVIIFTLIFGLLYAISDEFHQSFVPYRTASLVDVSYDVVGSFFGGLICRLLI